MRRSTLITAGALAWFASSFWIFFRAGCVGDTKTGAYGNPVSALHLEDVGFGVFAMGIVMVALCIGLFSSSRPFWRVIWSIAWLLIGVPGLCLTALEIEEWGVRSCSATKDNLAAAPSNPPLQRPGATVAALPLAPAAERPSR
jgi:hypothetical protein